MTLKEKGKRAKGKEGMLTRGAKIGVIGGSGFYNLAEKLKEVKVETPYGVPSDKIAIGRVNGRMVAFLPRHGKDHTIPPHRINYRANIWALKSLGVERIIATMAVGSLRREIKPGDIVILDQFINQTFRRNDTFYDGPVVTHVSAAFPFCPQLRTLSFNIAKKSKMPVHPKGTAVVIEGPHFSSAAESSWFKRMGGEVINMTAYPEVVLAVESQICYCGLAIVTDYDAGLLSGKRVRPVSVDMVVKNFLKNMEKVKELIFSLIGQWPSGFTCQCRNSLKGARF